MALKEALPHFVRPVLGMGYPTGMRLVEILGLKWNQGNLVEEKITLKAGKTKNNEARVIFLCGELLEAMKNQKALSDSLYRQSAYVFFGEGHPIR